MVVVGQQIEGSPAWASSCVAVPERASCRAQARPHDVYLLTTKSSFLCFLIIRICNSVSYYYCSFSEGFLDFEWVHVKRWDWEVGPHMPGWRRIEFWISNFSWLHIVNDASLFILTLGLCLSVYTNDVVGASSLDISVSLSLFFFFFFYFCTFFSASFLLATYSLA